MILSPDAEKEREALWHLVGFLLEQLGGSVALSITEATMIFDIDGSGSGKKVEISQLQDPWAFIIKVVDND